LNLKENNECQEKSCADKDARLILASQSPYRKQLLDKLGLAFDCHPAQIHEETLQSQFHGAAEDMARYLAQAKAQSLQKDFPKDWIIGSDQVLLFKGQALTKPKNRSEAIDRLQTLAGHEHHLYTAYYLLGPNWSHADQVISTMMMRPLTRAEIEAYVDLDQGIGCAGAYKIEAHGCQLFEQINTSDFFSIIGLPLLSLGQILRQVGFFRTSVHGDFS
jgi:septum formation protein